MANSYFRFKQFTIHQDQSAMKVTTDGCLFGAWAAKAIHERKPEQGRWLDIGTGTGLLSLMVAQQNPDNLIDAVEIEMAAAEEARKNIHTGFVCCFIVNFHRIDRSIRILLGYHQTE